MEEWVREEGMWRAAAVCVCVWEVVVCGSRACTCANSLCAAFSCITWICADSGNRSNACVDTSELFGLTPPGSLPVGSSGSRPVSSSA